MTIVDTLIVADTIPRPRLDVIIKILHFQMEYRLSMQSPTDDRSRWFEGVDNVIYTRRPPTKYISRPKMYSDPPSEMIEDNHVGNEHGI